MVLEERSNTFRSLLREMERLTKALDRNSDLLERAVDSDEKMAMLTASLFPQASEEAPVDVDMLDWYYGTSGFMIRPDPLTLDEPRPATPEEDAAIRARWPKAAQRIRR